MNFVKSIESKGKLLGRVISSLVLAKIDEKDIKPTKVKFRLDFHLQYSI